LPTPGNIEIIPVGKYTVVPRRRASSLIHPLAIANGGISDMHPQALPSIRQQFPTQAIINLAGTLIINRRP